MRILMVHNYYQEPGGEDVVFQDEAAMLRNERNEVETFAVHNDSIKGRGNLGVARDTIWNRRLAFEIADLARRHRARIVHFHNTFPLISPAAYSAVRRVGSAVVQTLHNYRLTCPGAHLSRDNHLCEDCVGRRIAWPAVVHGCYRENRLGSAVAAAMLSIHRVMKTWTRSVDRYIALTDFAREKFIEAGLPAEKIRVKPNFVYSDPGMGDGSEDFALFVGRLHSMKGVDTLLAAWDRSDVPLKLKIAGDGPLREEVRQCAARRSEVEYLGFVTGEEIIRLMRRAKLMIFPSHWYEGFPKSIAEALACGLPIVASKLGAMAEIVQDGVTGKLFEPRNADDLLRQVCWVLKCPDRLQQMRRAARAAFEGNFTRETNYRTLMEIYHDAISACEWAPAGALEIAEQMPNRGAKVLVTGQS